MENPPVTATAQEITSLLQAWRSGESAALDRLTPLVYRELKRLARHYMRDHERGTMQTTALVHEAYLRLVDLSGVGWQDRAHFYAVSSQIMRRIMVSAARASGSQKRGGLLRRLQPSTNFDLEQVPSLESIHEAEILAIHEALESLAAFAVRQAQVVEMRFFGGLTVEEIAEVLGISPQSVMRDWRLAKAWLAKELRRN